MIEIIKHPIIEHNLTTLRDKNSSPAHFRASIKKIAYFLAIHTFANLGLVETEVETAFEKTKCSKISQNVILVPILKAGIFMLEPFLELNPNSKIAYIGFSHLPNYSETSKFLYSLPEHSQNDYAIIFDLAIASGNTMSSAIAHLQLEGLTNISIASIISAPEGVEKIRTEYPTVKIFTTALDKEVNEKGLVIPGLGHTDEQFA